MSIQTGPQRHWRWHVEKQKASFICLLYKIKQETAECRFFCDTEVKRTITSPDSQMLKLFRQIARQPWRHALTKQQRKEAADALWHFQLSCVSLASNCHCGSSCSIVHKSTGMCRRVYVKRSCHSQWKRDSNLLLSTRQRFLGKALKTPDVQGHHPCMEARCHQCMRESYF